MHVVLETPDLLAVICSLCFDASPFELTPDALAYSRQTLAFFARTCQDINYTATLELWRYMNDLSPLLDMMAPDLWEVRWSLVQGNGNSRRRVRAFSLLNDPSSLSS